MDLRRHPYPLAYGCVRVSWPYNDTVHMYTAYDIVRSPNYWVLTLVGMS